MDPRHVFAMSAYDVHATDDRSYTKQVIACLTRAAATDCVLLASIAEFEFVPSTRVVQWQVRVFTLLMGVVKI